MCYQLVLLKKLDDDDDDVHYEYIYYLVNMLSLLWLACLIGFLFDVTAKYDMPFVVCGSIEMVGGVCALFAYVIRHRQRAAEHSS